MGYHRARPPLRLGNFLMVRGPLVGFAGAAEPMVNVTPPPAWGSDGAAPNGDDGDAAGLDAPNEKPPPPPDDPGGCGRPALPVAGDAGWLLNANGFDGAVAEVGVAPNAKGVGPGWPNVDGLAGCDCWPNPPLVLGPKANGALGAEEEA